MALAALAFGCGYTFADHDDTPTFVGGNYRDPVIDCTRSLATTVDDPLERHLDPTPRDR